MGKYFTVKIKPVLPALSAGMHAAFADNDLLWDWFSFEIPKGTCRIVGASLEVMPRQITSAAVNEYDLDLIFAKDVKNAVGGMAAPTSLGASNGALTADVNNRNHIVCNIPASTFVYEAHLDSTAFAKASPAKIGDAFLYGEPDSGTNVGYDRLYVAGVAAGAFDFRTNLAINNGTLDEDTFTVDTADPRLFMQPGDIIAFTADGSAAKPAGTIRNMPDENTIIITSTTTTAAVNDDLVYNTTPFTITLFCER